MDRHPFSIFKKPYQRLRKTYIEILKPATEHVALVFIEQLAEVVDI